MPSFELNKLVRVGLKEKYAELGQEAEYPELTVDELRQLLVKKIIEETVEIPLDGSIDEIVSEIGDVQQGLNDLMVLCGITLEQVEEARKKVFDYKGGFIDSSGKGVYVGTLTLKDGDPWVEYYRKEPSRFPEKK